MKEPLPKLHLIDSPVRLIEHTDIVPLCEMWKDVGDRVPIKKAVFELSVAEEICGDVEDMLDNIKGLCKECRTLTLEERYIYAIRTGVELKPKQKYQSAKEEVA